MSDHHFAAQAFELRHARPREHSLGLRQCFSHSNWEASRIRSSAQSDLNLLKVSSSNFIHHPVVRFSLVFLLVAAVTTVSGCGNKSPTVVPPSPIAKGGPQQPTAPISSEKPAPKLKSKQEAVQSPSVASADPKSVFVVTEVNEKMEVETAAPVREADQFQVVMGNPLWDSTSFVVSAAVPSPQAMSLVGTGQPKSDLKLPKEFTVVKEWGYTQDGWPMRIRNQKTGNLLAVVPAGPAIIGTDDGPDECKPTFKVRLDTFYMEVLEVTVEDFETFRADQRESSEKRERGDKKSDKKSEKVDKKTIPAAPANVDAPGKFPALGISVAGALAYARWAKMELPTESEFEKAGRGPNGLRYPWGEGSPLWSNRELSATGTTVADCSLYGIYDLAGNAKEWCTDFYSSNAHKEASEATNEKLRNWPGPTSTVRDKNLRVVKGSDEHFELWIREGKDAGKIDRAIGFRCVLRIKPESDSK